MTFNQNEYEIYIKSCEPKELISIYEGLVVEIGDLARMIWNGGDFKQDLNDAKNKQNVIYSEMLHRMVNRL